MPNERKELKHPDYIKEYPYLVSWGYRRPAHLIHPPAIVQHLGYWLADFKSSSDSKDGDNSRREQLFSRFCDAIEKNSEFECELHFVPKAEEKFRRRYQTCRLKSDKWHSLLVRMTLELHHEYIAVSTIIELPDSGNEAAHSSPLVIKLKSAIADLAKVTTKRYEDLSSHVKSSMRSVREDLKDTYRDIFLDIWNEFYDEIFSEPVREMGDEFEGVFADFRGFVVLSKDEDREFFTQSRTSPNRTAAPRRFSPNDSICRAHVILPFMTAEPDTRGKKEEKELTISRFLDGRCIYASTLGAQPPETKPDSLEPSPETKTNNQEPITYFVLTTGSNSWETGRLLDRIHTLGTMRLAARRFLGLLEEAGDNLHDLERDLKNIDALIGKMNSLADAISDSASKDAMGALSEASTRLLGIRSKVPGELPYRVERSRYYRSQFNSLVTALRIVPRGRIEGFQPYHEFVERRFGSAYEFIDMVNKRFDRTDRQLLTFYQRVRAEETRREVAAIERFQKVAEYGFFLVLFMYYMGHALVALLFPVVAGSEPLTRLLSPDARSKMEQILTVVAFIAGAIIVSLREPRVRALAASFLKRNKEMGKLLWKRFRTFPINFVSSLKKIKQKKEKESGSEKNGKLYWKRFYPGQKFLGPYKGIMDFMRRKRSERKARKTKIGGSS